MYDIERITRTVADIEKYLRELDECNINSKEDLLDTKTYHAASMIIFTILNKVIDLGNEVIATEQLGAPNRYQDIMHILAKAGVMNLQESDQISELIKKRNLIAHFYDDLTEQELLNMIKNISIIQTFIERIKKRASEKIK